MDAVASSSPSDSPSNRKHLFRLRPIRRLRGVLLPAAQKGDILRAESEYYRDYIKSESSASGGEASKLLRS